MFESFIGSESFGGFIDEETRDEVDGLRRGGETEDLRPGVGLYFREVKVGERAVHGFDLFAGGRAQHFDDFDQLIDSGLAGKQRLAKQQLGQHATGGPEIDAGCVVGGAKDEFWSAIVARADVSHVGFAFNQPLGAAPVAQFEHVRLGIDQQILWLDVPMAD